LGGGDELGLAGNAEFLGVGGLDCADGVKGVEHGFRLPFGMGVGILS
jgi:hypothetical protein